MPVRASESECDGESLHIWPIYFISFFFVVVVVVIDDVRCVHSFPFIRRAKSIYSELNEHLKIGSKLKWIRRHNSPSIASTGTRVTHQIWRHFGVLGHRSSDAKWTTAMVSAVGCSGANLTAFRFSHWHWHRFQHHIVIPSYSKQQIHTHTYVHYIMYESQQSVVCFFFCFFFPLFFIFCFIIHSKSAVSSSTLFPFDLIETECAQSICNVSEMMRRHRRSSFCFSSRF